MIAARKVSTEIPVLSYQPLPSQSPDIDMGVSKSLEAKGGDDVDIDKIGAGDQGMMFGFACNETPTSHADANLSRAQTHSAVWQRCARMARCPGFRPDGKSQVTVQYAQGSPKRIDTVFDFHTTRTGNFPRRDHRASNRERDPSIHAKGYGG